MKNEKLKKGFLLLNIFLKFHFILTQDFSDTDINFVRFLGLSSSDVLRKQPQKSIVCYDNVGCFDNNPPFNNAAFYLPISPNELKTQFLLYTSQIGTDRLSYTDENSIQNSKFNKNYPLKIVIHGFQNTGFTPWVIKIVNHLLIAVINTNKIFFKLYLKI